jgi:hypothetical protein
MWVTHHAVIYVIKSNRVKPSNITNLEAKMGSSIEKNNCQSIYQNLLECSQEKDIPATAYIRLFFETSR